jgi:hypothetical protein
VALCKSSAKGQNHPANASAGGRSKPLAVAAGNRFFQLSKSLALSYTKSVFMSTGLE